MPSGIYPRTEYHITRLSESKKGRKPKNYELFRSLAYIPEKKTHKLCLICKKIKDRSFFMGPKAKKMHAYCMECYRKKAKDYRNNNPEKFREIHRRSNIKAIFGITLEEYDLMLVKQKNVCAICFKNPDKKRRLSIDHDHSTGKIRGLLCNSCNRGIGQLKDSSEILKNAYEYLERSKLA